VDHAVWRHNLKYAPDDARPRELGAVSEFVSARLHALSEQLVGKPGRQQRLLPALISKGEMSRQPELGTFSRERTCATPREIPGSIAGLAERGRLPPALRFNVTDALRLI